MCNGEAILKTTMPIDAKTFQPTPHGKIYHCSTCGAGFVHPRPSPTETEHFYELDSYYTNGVSHMVETGPPGFSSRLRMHLAWRLDASQPLFDLICAALEPKARIVDIGCGGGVLLGQLKELGFDVVGVERSAHTLTLSGQPTYVLEGSAESLPDSLRLGSYDGVVFSHVLEHLCDPIAALRTAAALLKPAGLLFCEVPNNESLIARQSGLSWENLDIPRHLNFFNESSLVALAQSAGLEVSRTYFSGYCRYYTDSYIATEQRIFDQLANGSREPISAKRNSHMRCWSLLAKTAFATPWEKYDSVGIIARLA